MRHGGTRGGMQSASLHYSLICPQCGQPAFRRDDIGDAYEYHHFTNTRKGYKTHTVKKKGGGRNVIPNGAG